MESYRKILVGVDLALEGDRISQGSRRAAMQAEWLARRTGAALTFLHSTWADVYEDHLQVRSGPGPDGAQALQDFVDDYQKSDLPVELEFTKERPWLEIIRRVQSGRNDFVVVGRRNDAGSMLGSTTRKLMRYCPAPVWAVKADTELVHDRILAASDLTAVGDRAVELGAYVAAACDAELHVVHAWQVPLQVQMSAETVGQEAHQAELQKIHDDAVKHLEGVLEACQASPKAKLHVGRDAASRAILEGTKALDPELVVMGTVSRTGIPGLLVGNTAEKLLDRIECALLTVKPEGFDAPVS